MMKFVAPFLVLIAGMLFVGHAEAQSFVVGVTTCGTAPSTIVNGRPAYLTVDTTGKLCDTGASGGGAAATNITQWASVALGAPSAYGTSPGAVIVPGVNAFVTNFPTNQIVVGPTADGSPATTAPVLIGGTSDGTATGTVDVWKVDASGLGYVLDSTGTAIQAPVAPATATATKSALGGCQATSAAINPTTGQQAAIDCDLNNNLLVSSGGAPNLATAQVSVTTGNISVAAARALRRAVTITNVTGTSAIYCGNTGVATTTGAYLGSTTGSSITLNTTAAIFCTVAATTQTVTVAETY